MELGRARVERHADLGAERHELVDRPLFSRAHVGRGHDADASAAGNDVRERVAQVADPGPDDERADQVDRLGARELGADLRADVGLTLGVDQEVALTERRGREWRERHRVAERGARLDPGEHARRQLELGVASVIEPLEVFR